MDILFVHGNYPAQFRAQARAVAADPGHRVVYATERDPVPRRRDLPRAALVRYTPHRPPSAAIHPYLAPARTPCCMGQAVVRCLQESADGRAFSRGWWSFTPGGGWGCSCASCCPQAALVAYCEWYFKPADLPWLKGRSEVNAALAIGLRNSALLLETGGGGSGRGAHGLAAAAVSSRHAGPAAGAVRWH